jgi:hypothetical protein
VVGSDRAAAVHGVGREVTDEEVKLAVEQKITAATETMRTLTDLVFLGHLTLPRPQDSYFDGIQGFLRDMKRKIGDPE